MAVQAQYPSNAFTIDFRNRTRNTPMDELQFQNQEYQTTNLYRNFNYMGQVINGTVFSDPESELTCNISGSRKRTREEPVALTPLQQQQILNQLRYGNFMKLQEKSGQISTGLNVSHEETRLNQSIGTSTSGRPPTGTGHPSSPFTQEVMASLYQQNEEIDALIRLQSEKIRLGLEEKRQRHFRALLSVLEQQIWKRLKEKETELENVSRRNAELEEKVRQMSLENQIWQHAARNNESMVSNLKSSLEQVLSQNMNMAGQTKEGYGDSEANTAIAAGADDAQSSCYNGGMDSEARAFKENQELKHRRTCKICRKSEISILLLPCRHLCLCKDCESKFDVCPLCNSRKNASLQIHL
ncbi:probable BOI-related E3 ubiquitin-protein ligase 3 [Amborella trichopoda]|uniref:RING-type domain-containing protein n=1 Tax=Amborella trichopoda TaxID=13333 RepID=W1PEK7_AMBTC|nr:probable BOI-related E3 ubiquitin-protein ligase 3 [Amborella trichopoda]ERN06388.1 hypothetical protein AMTR_s00016p00251370 [Amborella trichopoda]|eukprot:XP_006844713.1 probable BOI-related E3 ubiquitin-protein ligase 3 [Amborella trichopoda]